MRQLARIAKGARLLLRREHRAALRYGIGASIELEPIPVSPRARTVVDVGANRGQFAAFALARFPAATIHSFEPFPRARDRLARFARERGQGRIVVHGDALGSSDRTATLHVTSEDDSSSLLPPGPAQIGLGTREVGRVTVAVRRLDSVLGPADIALPALLKIDVQGSELDVLRGAGDLLGLFDEILVECSYTPFYEGQPMAREVIQHLRSRGWDVRHVQPSLKARGAVLQADLLFARRP